MQDRFKAGESKVIKTMLTGGYEEKYASQTSSGLKYGDDDESKRKNANRQELG